MPVEIAKERSRFPRFSGTLEPKNGPKSSAKIRFRVPRPPAPGWPGTRSIHVKIRAFQRLLCLEPPSYVTHRIASHHATLYALVLAQMQIVCVSGVCCFALFLRIGRSE